MSIDMTCLSHPSLSQNHCSQKTALLQTPLQLPQFPLYLPERRFQFFQLLALGLEHGVEAGKIAFDLVSYGLDVGEELVAQAGFQVFAASLDFFAEAFEDFSLLGGGGDAREEQPQAGEYAAGDVEDGAIGDGCEDGSDQGDAAAGEHVGGDVFIVGEELGGFEGVSAFQHLPEGRLQIVEDFGPLLADVAEEVHVFAQGGAAVLDFEVYELGHLLDAEGEVADAFAQLVLEAVFQFPSHFAGEAFESFFEAGAFGEQARQAAAQQGEEGEFAGELAFFFGGDLAVGGYGIFDEALGLALGLLRLAVKDLADFPAEVLVGFVLFAAGFQGFAEALGQGGGDGEAVF